MSTAKTGVLLAPRIFQPLVRGITQISYQLNTSCIRLIIDWFILVILEYDFDLSSGFAGEVRQFVPYDQ